MKVATCIKCNKQYNELHNFVRNYKTGGSHRFRLVCGYCVDDSNQTCTQCHKVGDSQKNPVVVCDGCGDAGQKCLKCLGVERVPDGAWTCSRACDELIRGSKRPLEAAEEEEEQVVLFDDDEGPDSLPSIGDVIDLSSPPKKHVTLEQQKARLLENLYAKYTAIKKTEAMAAELAKLQSACLRDVHAALTDRLGLLESAAAVVLQQLAKGCPELATLTAEAQLMFMANTQMMIGQHAKSAEEMASLKGKLAQIGPPLARQMELEQMDLSVEPLPLVLDRAMTEYEFICSDTT